MDNLVDLHTHILPGLDDGPESIRESVEMVQALHDMGFRHVFATPHHRLYSWEGLQSKSVMSGLVELEEALSDKELEIRLYPGFEYDLDDTLAQRAQERPVGARHILVDIGFWDVPNNLPELMNELSVLGVKILLVHPERNGVLCRQTGVLKSLTDSGVRLVGNLGSLSGLYGRLVRKDCLSILQAGSYWAMASDLHSLEQVSWIRKGLDHLRRETGIAGLRDLVHNNPMEITENFTEETS